MLLLHAQTISPQPYLLLRFHFIDFLWLLNIACCTVACCKFYECDSLKIYPIQIFSANASSWCAKCTTMKLNCRRPHPTTMSNHWREAILFMIASHGSAWSAGRSSTWAICFIQFRWCTKLRSWMNVEMFEDTFELRYNRLWWVNNAKGSFHKWRLIIKEMNVIKYCTLNVNWNLEKHLEKTSSRME